MENKPRDNSWDPVWEDVFSKQPWGRYPGEDLIRFVARNFYSAPDRRNIKILEVGCGPGGNLWFMAREGFSVFGIDRSQTAINQAQRRLDEEAPGWQGNLIVGDIMSLPFDSEFFDAVIDNECVYCNSFKNSQYIYKEIARVTKRNGKLFSRTFAKGTWGEKTGKNVGHNAWIPDRGPLQGKGFARFTGSHEILELLGKAFELDEVELITRTVGGHDSGHLVAEWIIHAHKI